MTEDCGRISMKWRIPVVLSLPLSCFVRKICRRFLLSGNERRAHALLDPSHVTTMCTVFFFFLEITLQHISCDLLYSGRESTRRTRSVIRVLCYLWSFLFFRIKRRLRLFCFSHKITLFVFFGAKFTLCGGFESDFGIDFGNKLL